jgi:TonB family protein
MAMNRIALSLLFICGAAIGNGGSTNALNALKACIQNTLNEQAVEIGTLYEENLKYDPTLKGLIRIRFKVDTTGEVQEAEIVETTTGAVEFDYEVNKRVLSWSFERCDLQEELEITYPFSFESGYREPSPEQTKNALTVITLVFSVLTLITAVMATQKISPSN